MKKKPVEPHLSTDKALSTAKYINPYTDFGFKKLFGQEANKVLIIDFLNQLLPQEHQIVELSFHNPEHLPDLPLERRAIFDIYCTAKSGEYFIVEMQKAKFDYFKDRSLFYSTFPIREQGVRGEWDFKLRPVYFIAILDFEYDVEDERRKFLRHVALKDQDGDLFYDKLHFKFIQMPLFRKEIDELVSRFDKWCYFLKHLEDFSKIPSILDESVFQRAFEVAALAGLSAAERRAYDESLMHYWTFQGVMDTAVRDAVKEAVSAERKRGVLEKVHALEQAEQKAQAEKEQALKQAKQKAQAEKEQALKQAKHQDLVKMVKNMFEQGLDEQTIAVVTGLELAAVRDLKKQSK